MKKKILVVEDDAAILTGLIDLFTNEGYNVLSTTDGKRAIDIFNTKNPDIILLDIMIPEKSGYEVCKEIRQRNRHIPIIMLTAKGQEVDKVVGLEIGADDYIVKPFAVNELLARVRAVLRRSDLKLQRNKDQTIMQFEDITINPKTLSINKGDAQFSISQRELHLLQLFYKHDGEIIDRMTLLEEVWGIKYEGTTRTLDQHIAQLRKKIEQSPSKPEHIITVHGVGYKFTSRR